MNRKSAADEYEIVEVAKKKQAEQSAAIPSKRGSDEHVGHRKERTESGMEIKDTRVKYYADESHKELPLYRDQELISPPAVDERVAHRQEGLSSKKCCKVIVEEAKAVLNEFQQQQFNQQHWHTYLRQPWAWLGFLISTLLFLFYILIVFRAGLQWSGRTGIIVEGLFIGAVTAWNIWLLWRENRFARREIIQRIQLIIGRLEKNGLNAIQELNVPNCRAISMARVVRDGVMRSFPFCLLVKGDVIEMSFGDIAPADAEYVYLTAPPDTGERYHLKQGQMFRPAAFWAATSNGWTEKMFEEAKHAQGRYQFRLQQTPLISTIRDALNYRRPQPLIYQQMKRFYFLIYQRLIWILLAIAILFNVVRFALTPARHVTWMGVLIINSVYVIIPLLPFAAYTAWALTRALGNARILLLFDQLQQSLTPFDDSVSVDEFDEEALPPTKDVSVASSTLLFKFLSILRHRGDNALMHSSSLVESLGSTSVICSVDREGTISSIFPTMEQLYFFAEEQPQEPAIIDLTVDESDGGRLIVEEKDWRRYLNTLRPLGLNLLLNTDCGAAVTTTNKTAATTTATTNTAAVKPKPDPHRKAAHLVLHGCPRPARQSCNCVLAREIGGLAPETLGHYRSSKDVYLFDPRQLPDSTASGSCRDDQFEVPSCTMKILKDERQGTDFIFSDGSLKILEFCSDYWDGSTVQPLTDQIRKKIQDFYHNATVNDSQCVLYSYSPIVDADDQLNALLKSNREYYEFTEAMKEFDQVISNQIFLCLIAMGHQPKEDVNEFIEDLKLAGIRFVYFSNLAERESKAFAERLGLETDWNSCILLSSPGENSGGYIQSHDIKAKLPRGIENIRPHIANVDDIPLHVSLFADCRPDAVREMIRVYQENGEVVCCTGSALHSVNTSLFAAADISIAMMPSQMKSLSQISGSSTPPFTLGSALVSLPAALTVRYETSPYTLTQIIREARIFVTNSLQAFLYTTGSQVSISILTVLSTVLFLPPIFVGYQILWLTVIINPLIAVSFLFSPAEDDPDVMQLMPAKNRDHVKDLGKICWYFIWRFLPIIASTLVTFIVALLIFIPGHTISVGDDGWLTDMNKQWAVVYAQTSAMFVFVLNSVFASACFLQRTSSIFKYSPHRNPVWIICGVLAVVLQTAFTAISIHQGPLSFPGSNLIWVLVLSLATPVLTVTMQELVKRHDLKEFMRFQKRSKLEFNTKLGCYSPV